MAVDLAGTSTADTALSQFQALSEKKKRGILTPEEQVQYDALIRANPALSDTVRSSPIGPNGVPLGPTGELQTAAMGRPGSPIIPPNTLNLPNVPTEPPQFVGRPGATPLRFGMDEPTNTLNPPGPSLAKPTLEASTGPTAPTGTSAANPAGKTDWFKLLMEMGAPALGLALGGTTGLAMGVNVGTGYMEEEGKKKKEQDLARKAALTEAKQAEMDRHAKELERLAQAKVTAQEETNRIKKAENAAKEKEKDVREKERADAARQKLPLELDALKAKAEKDRRPPQAKLTPAEKLVQVVKDGKRIWLPQSQAAGIEIPTKAEDPWKKKGGGPDDVVNPPKSPVGLTAEETAELAALKAEAVANGGQLVPEKAARFNVLRNKKLGK